MSSPLRCTRTSLLVVSACAALLIASASSSSPGALAAAASAEHLAGNAGSPARSARESYPNAVLSDSPISYWRLGESEAHWAADATGIHDAWYAGFLGGAPTGLLGRPGALADDENTSVQMLGFQDPYGLGRQHLTVSDPEFKFPGQTAFALEAWVRPESLNGHTRRVFSGESTPPPTPAAGNATADSGYLVGVRSDGLVFSRYRAGRWSTLKTPIAPGRWSHVFASYDSAEMRLYVNGQWRGSLQSSIVLPDRGGQDTLVLGAKQGIWKFFAGGLDEVAIYRHPLLPARIEAHYLAGVGSGR